MSELANIEYVKMWIAKFGPTQYEDNIFKFAELAIAQHAEIERLKKAYTLTVASWQIRAEKAEAEIEKLRAANKDSKAWFAEVLARAEKAEAEVERLKERLGPLGLEVLMIGEAGHYVNSKVKAEFERLKAALVRINAEHSCGCSPCTGQCTSKESLEITIAAMKDIAAESLSKVKT